MSWPTVQITEVAKVVGGATPKSKVEDYWGGAVHWATPKDLSDLQSQYISETPRTITEAGLKSCAAEVMPEGTVLFSSRAPIGHIAITKTPMATNQGFKSFVPGPKLDAGFLYWWLDANREKLQALGTGATFKEVSKATVQRIEIPLPPLEEQKRIAGILDQAAELCRLRTYALDKLNTLGQAIFHEMFGDPATNPYGWNLTTLPELGTLDRGVSKHRPRNDPTLLGGDHPLIQTGDVSRALDYITEYTSTYSDLGLSQSRKWASGTVCITIAANIADTAILDFESCFPDSVVGFDSGSPETNFFVHRWFSTVKRRLENIAPAVAQKNINLKILRELPVIKPPSQLIEEYYAKERQIRAKCVLVGRAAEQSQTLFASLQHRAFRGEL